MHVDKKIIYFKVLNEENVRFREVLTLHNLKKLFISFKVDSTAQQRTCRNIAFIMCYKTREVVQWYIPHDNYL